MPTSPILQRRHLEIRSRLGSLETEFDHWRNRTAAGPLGRHHSQVRRLATQLGGLLDQVRADLPSTADDTLLRNARRWESAILAAHTLWEFFRSKLVLRESDLFREHLAACDDFAWACYQPARDALAGDTFREPPLVYFNALWSPFAMPRDQTFAAEIRAAQGLGGALSAERFQAVLDQLPIPLIGLPWYQTAHLPAGLILAHEIGHVVDWDFHLDPAIEASVAATTGQGVPPERLGDWGAWRHEVFADLFATCAAGPAFVGALLDLLAATPAEIRAETGLGNAHPPRVLRVALACRALEFLNLPADARRLRAEWESLAGPADTAAAASHLPDVPAIVDALLQVPFRGRALPGIIRPPAGAPDRLAAKIAQNFEPDARLDVRDAFAAARWLQENRPDTDLVVATNRIRKRLAAQPLDAVRGTATPPVIRGTTLTHASAPDPDRASGQRLLSALFPDDWPSP